LWHSSWLIFIQNPWFGTGIGSFYPQLLLLIENGLIDPAASNTHHPHSQFFSSIAAYGVFGPLSIFSIYMSFIWYCKIHVSQHKSLAIAGVITAIAYMDFGLVEMIWDINNAGVLFVMMMALIAGQLSYQARTKSLE
jgi:O-antigen ligase